MIVYKRWQIYKEGLRTTYWEGWFFLGFIPIYIRQTNDRYIWE